MAMNAPEELKKAFVHRRTVRYPKEDFDSFNPALIEGIEKLTQQDFNLGTYAKILVFDTSDNPACNVEELIAILEQLNDGRSRAVCVNRFVVALLYGSGFTDFTGLWFHQLMTTLEEEVHKPFGLVCGISEPFDDLARISEAFKQALYALEYRDYLLREMKIMHEDEQIEEVIAGAAFEQVLPYYLVEEGYEDEAFVGFCLSNAFLTEILANDLRDGTKNFQILWFYLAYERNASLAGRRMFMHRNSILYHINQIEERYDFNLDRRYFREKLMLDFRLVFMALSESSLDKLFGL